MRSNSNPSNARRSLLSGLGHGFAIYFALFVCIVVGAGGAVVVIFLWAPAWYRVNSTMIATVIYLWVAPGEYFSMYFLGDRLEKVLDADPIDLALEQRISSLVYRPLVALWWAAHFALAIVLAHWLAQYYWEAGVRHHTILVYTSSVFVQFAGAVAANFFMLLSLAALFPNAHLLRQVWRLRLLVDLGVAFVPLPALPMVMGAR